MNTRRPIDESSAPIALNASFNQENDCFAVGLDTGFCVFNSDPCVLKVSRDFNAGIGMAEMLGKSNYVALVGGGKQPKFPQNKVIIWDDAKQKAVITLEFRTSVCRVRLNRSRLVVTLQNSVHIHEFSAPPKLISTFETADNLDGLCSLSQSIIAFPGRTPGQAQLVEIESGNVSIIPAHTTALKAMDLSQDGGLLATASEAGTLIRVFSTGNCSRIAELRRGVDRASIFSLSFSPDSSILAATSDKSTLHVFDVPVAGSKSISKPRQSSGSQSHTDEEAPSRKWGLMGKIPFLPRVFSDEYSFASATFESGDDPSPVPSLSSAPLPPIPGIPKGRPVKGVIGWYDDYTVLVLGAGRDGRWEKFQMVEGEEGKRYCIKKGWKRYLGT